MYATVRNSLAIMRVHKGGSRSQFPANFFKQIPVPVRILAIPANYTADSV